MVKVNGMTIWFNFVNAKARYKLIDYETPDVWRARLISSKGPV